MVEYTATVGGKQVDKVFNVNYADGGQTKVGDATIEAANNAFNKQFSSGDKVVIKKNGSVDFKGHLEGQPTKAGASNVSVRMQASGPEDELSKINVKRLFYDMDTGAIIREAVSNRVRRVDPVYASKGLNLGNWSTNADVLDRGNITSRRLSETGGDFIFVGWQKGSGGGVYTITSGLPSKAIPGDGLLESVETRLLVNNEGQQFRGEFTIVDGYGSTYNWEMDIQSTTFQTHSFRAEEATPNPSIGSNPSRSNVMQFRFELPGVLPEPRAAAIDYVQIQPFETKSRKTSLSVDAVKNTNRKITRRFDTDAYQLLKNLSKEDQYTFWVDDDRVLHYEQSGGRNAPKSITYSDTRVTDATFNRDYKQIDNRVTVRGAGNVSVTASDPSSIDYYGVQPRPEDVVDKSIQTKQEARERAEGHLKENAWNDVAMEFEIANTNYQNVGVGQQITVRWPPENINGRYTISKKQTDKHGIVTVGVTQNGIE